MFEVGETVIAVVDGTRGEVYAVDDSYVFVRWADGDGSDDFGVCYALDNDVIRKKEWFE